MIKPYGAEELTPLYVADESQRRALAEEARGLPSVLITSSAAGNAVMLGAGYFTPLRGFMSIDEALAVAKRMELSGLGFWPVPIVNVVDGGQITRIAPGSRIALRDPNVRGHPALAVQDVTGVERLTEGQVTTIVENVFRTTDPDHPGVAALRGADNVVVSGPIQVLNYSHFSEDFPETFRTAPQIRAMIEERGWRKVIAFQTRNPMHRAHEELCRMAQKEVGADGILIHMLLGKLQPGDFPADVRDAAIRKMVELYFPAGTVLVTGYGFDMMYAGPREALLHAIFRQNAGATHLIIGRDHAGFRDFYGAFDAHTIFDEIPPDALQIQIFRGDHTVWCFKCDNVVMMRDCPHDSEDHLPLSGTKARDMLAKGEPLPPEFARPEVAEILSAYYQTLSSK